METQRTITASLHALQIHAPGGESTRWAPALRAMTHNSNSSDQITSQPHSVKEGRLVVQRYSY